MSRFTALAGCLTAIGWAAAGSAGPIDISFVDLDLVYDGQSISDGNPDGPAPVTLLIVDDSGDPADADPVVQNGTIDLLLPGLPDLPADGGTITSFEDGLLEITVPTGEVVRMSLSSVTIGYLDIGGLTGFAFAAALGGPTPDGPPTITHVPPSTVSLQATLDNATIDGGVVTGFSATATGQVRDAVVVVPEPTGVVAIGLLAALGSAAAVMRARIG